MTIATARSSRSPQCFAGVPRRVHAKLPNDLREPRAAAHRVEELVGEGRVHDPGVTHRRAVLHGLEHPRRITQARVRA